MFIASDILGIVMPQEKKNYIGIAYHLLINLVCSTLLSFLEDGACCHFPAFKDGAFGHFPAFKGDVFGHFPALKVTSLVIAVRSFPA